MKTYTPADFNATFDLTVTSGEAAQPRLYFRRSSDERRVSLVNFDTSANRVVSSTRLMALPRLSSTRQRRLRMSPALVTIGYGRSVWRLPQDLVWLHRTGGMECQRLRHQRPAAPTTRSALLLLA